MKTFPMKIADFVLDHAGRAETPGVVTEIVAESESTVTHRYVLRTNLIEKTTAFEGHGFIIGRKNKSLTQLAGDTGLTLASSINKIDFQICDTLRAFY